MIEDLAHDAFQAARDGNQGAVYAALNELVWSDVALNTAAQTWMDRLLVVAGAQLDSEVRLRVEMLPDNSSTGLPPAVLPETVIWVGKVFVAYAAGGMGDWRRLWDEVPPARRYAHAARLVDVMAKTCLAYEEDLTANPPERCCAIHAWTLGDPARTGALLAKAHLN